MRFSLFGAVLLSALVLRGQIPAVPEDPERVRELVSAGALPRSALDRLEDERADQADQAVLKRLLYGAATLEELTEEQAGEMMAAAQRRWERKRRKLDDAKRLVEEGVQARLGLSPLIEDLDAARKTLDLAESRARLLRELAEMARAEEAFEEVREERPRETPRIAERYDGEGVFLTSHLKAITLAFERAFGGALPISARGDTALHRALGFDHRGRVDVALNPDETRGVWLRRFLEELRVPYFAFRGYVRGKSTAPHIHIGPPSERLGGSD